MKIVTDKKCPLCGCEKMIRIDQPTFSPTTNHENDIYYLGAFKAIKTTRYVCYDCGYLLRLYEGSELEKIKKRVEE